MDASTTDWVDHGDYLGYMFVTNDGSPDTDSPSNRANFQRHLLLEVLQYLEIIEYYRGYDGHYYDIGIKKR